MAASFAYSPEIWPPLAAALFVAALGLYSWRQGRLPGARPFAIACLFWALWLLGNAAQAAAAGLPEQVAARTFQGLWRLPAATAIFCFTLEYVRPGRWLTPRNLILLGVPPVAAAVVITGSYVSALSRNTLPLAGAMQLEFAVASWLIVAYSLLLALLQVVALGWLFVRSPQHRWPAGLMAATVVVTRTLVLRDLLPPGAVPPAENVLLALVLPALAYAIALFGFRIFDPLPAARETVLQQMPSGVIVFDTAWQIVSLNPAAERMLGFSSGAAMGKTWHALVSPGQFLATIPDTAVHPAAGTSQLPEIAVGSGSTSRVYAPALSALTDFRGPLLGHLLILRDVTNERRAQAQLLEQQRTLAVLQERERLARELHDGLGQSLAATHLQASAARLLLDQGEPDRAAEQLVNLCETTLQSQADMREYLLGAQSVVSADRPFSVALQDYFRRFTRQYGLPVELIVPPELAEPGLSQAVQVQLMRIIQEALSNVRKHAGARCVQVLFSPAGGQVQLDIVDDGRGFDPAAVVPPGEGYGLQSMRERAEAVGGSLAVIAQPGTGTRVVVRVPSKERALDYVT